MDCHAIVRVLIVDDQVPFRRAAQAVVESTDSFVVIGAVATRRGRIGRSVADLEPDLVLMDVNLPGIDGMEASRRLRASHRGSWSSCCRPMTRPSSPT